MSDARTAHRAASSPRTRRLAWLAHLTRRRLSGAGLAAGLIISLAAVTSTALHAAEPLRVCLANNNPPLSWQRGDVSGGFELRIAQALAEALGRPLQAFWFEPEQDNDASLALQVNALLSAGKCELAAGFVLYAPELGRPAAARARLPDYDGAPPKRERAFVELGSLIASAPYQASALGVVLAPGARGHSVHSLADLTDLRIGAIAGSLGGMLVASYRGGLLRERVVSLGQREDLFDALAAGRVDAALVPINKFDAWRRTHPDGALRLSEYRHPFRFNLGFVALDTHAALIAQVDRFLADARARDRFASWANDTGTTAVAPIPPAVQPPLSMPALRRAGDD